MCSSIEFLIRLSFFVLVAHGSYELPLDVCEACCEVVLPSSSPTLFEKNAACEGGCTNLVTIAQIDADDLDALPPFKKQACSVHNLECKVGVDWASSAFTTRNVPDSVGNILNGTTRFCAPPGVIDNTAGPTVSPTTSAPTTPTLFPSTSPTHSPTITIPSNPIDTTTALIASLGGLGGLTLIVGLIYLRSKRSYEKDQKERMRKSDKAWISKEMALKPSPVRPPPPQEEFLGPPPGMGPPGLDPPKPKGEIEIIYNDGQQEVAGMATPFMDEDVDENETNMQKPFRVIAAFEAENPDELSVNEGDVIYGVRPLNIDWWIAESNGVRGIVPLNFLEEINEG